MTARPTAQERLIQRYQRLLRTEVATAWQGSRESDTAPPNASVRTAPAAEPARRFVKRGES